MTATYIPVIMDLVDKIISEDRKRKYSNALVVKILFLQSLYNLSDQQAEKEIHDRISFMNFLDYPDILPDSKTIWFFRERLLKTGRDRIVWNERLDVFPHQLFNIFIGNSFILTEEVFNQ